MGIGENIKGTVKEKLGDALDDDNLNDKDRNDAVIKAAGKAMQSQTKDVYRDALEKERHGRGAILVTQLGKDLREIGRMLLLQQIDEIGRRADAKQALHGIEDDVNPALSHENRTL